MSRKPWLAKYSASAMVETVIGPGSRGNTSSGDVDALGRLHMRAQHHAKLLGVLGQALNVALEPSAVQKQRRGDQGVDRLSRLCPLIGLPPSCP